MPNVIADRSIANEPSSAGLRRTKRRPSPIERPIDSRSPAELRQLRRQRRRRAPTIARQLSASTAYARLDARGGDQQAAEPRPEHHRQLVEAEVHRQRRGHVLARDEVGHDRRAHDVLQRAEAGQQPGEDEQHARSAGRPRPPPRTAPPATATSPIWSSSSSRRRSLRSASAPPSSAMSDERPELDGAEQPGQQRRARLDVDLVGQRDERRLRPEARRRSCRARAAAARATRAAR